MKKQKTVIDQLTAMLGFKVDPEALSRADEKLKDLDRRIEKISENLRRSKCPALEEQS